MTINTEDIIKSLFALGYKEVDCITFTYTLGKIMKEYNNTIFEDKQLTKTFNKYFDFDGIYFKINPIYNIESIIFENGDYKYSLRDFLSSNQELIELLRKNLKPSIISEEHQKLLKLFKK